MIPMNSIRMLLCLLLCSTFGWSQTTYGTLEVNPTALQKDFQKWFKYQSTKIMLSTDFIGLDTKRNPVSKEQFLEKLTSGSYIPIR
ncbi:MAG: Thiol-disulfide oxidoreductase ResA, partial [Bacteroidota bacterium]